MLKQNICIIGQEDSKIQSKGVLNQYQLRYGELPIEKLEANLSAFVESLGVVFDNLSAPIKSFELDEIEVKVDISINGGVSLVGSVEAGTSGGVTLKFKRK